MRTDDVEKLLRCVAEIHEWQVESSFPEHAARVLSHLIDGRVSTYQALDFAGGTTEAAFSEPVPEIFAHAEAFVRHVHEHPLINHQKHTRDERALRISDVIQTRPYRRTAIYNEFYRKVNLPHQLAVGLSEKRNEVVGLLVSRDGAEFTVRERQMLNLFRMHVLDAKKQAARCRHLLNYARQARGMLESLREGVVALDGELRVRHRTVRAAEILGRHFPVGPCIKKGELPEAVKAWIAHEAECLQARRVAGIRRQVLLATDRGGLRLELVRNEKYPAPGPGWTLVVEERGGKWEAENLVTLGLTEREAEILLWLCQGKSNPEIAVIVGAGARTVEKHVERILKKLGVESRGAAAVRAMELLF